MVVKLSTWGFGKRNSFRDAALRCLWREGTKLNNCRVPSFPKEGGAAKHACNNSWQPTDKK